MQSWNEVWNVKKIKISFLKVTDLTKTYEMRTAENYSAPC